MAADSPLKSPRTARFQEATAVDSPVEPATTRPFDPPPADYSSFRPQLQPGDVGFGYINDRRSLHSIQHVEMPPDKDAPLKSALKSPGLLSPGAKSMNLKSPAFAESVLSPTWREERLLEKREERTTKEQAHDLVRVRMAKMVLRMTNFSCSLIVLAMVGTVLTIFYSTFKLAPRNNTPAWSPTTPKWPQITLLVIACISLVFSVVILGAYCRGGHRRAEKMSVYFSVLAVGFFVFSIVMWSLGAGLFQHAHDSNNGQDMWAWSCKQNTRAVIFGDDVNYKLLCRLQNWSLVCCIIEIVVEVITLLIYAIVFYRYWSKRQLRKSMAARDKARSALYMSQMRSGANTPAWPLSPGVVGAPLSPREGGYNPMFSPRFAGDAGAAERGEAAPDTEPAKPFKLSAPPTKSPRVQQAAFGGSGGSGVYPGTAPAPLAGNPAGASRAGTPAGLAPAPAPAAPGEQQYAAVPIPGAYTALASPR